MDNVRAMLSTILPDVTQVETQRLGKIELGRADRLLSSEQRRRLKVDLGPVKRRFSLSEEVLNSHLLDNISNDLLGKFP